MEACINGRNSIEYIPGTESNQLVPDALSRLVEDNRPPNVKKKHEEEEEIRHQLNLIMTNETK